MSMNVFISYAQEDEPLARGLATALWHKGVGYFSFMHTKPIPGTDFSQVIANGIVQAHFVALLWGQRSCASPWVNGELNYAMQCQKTIIPILIDSNTPLPPALARIQAIPAYSDPVGWVFQFSDAIVQIIQMLQFQAQQQQALLQQQAMAQQQALMHQQAMTQPQPQASENDSLWKKIAGGVIGVGAIAAIAAALDK